MEQKNILKHRLGMSNLKSNYHTKFKTNLCTFGCLDIEDNEHLNQCKYTSSRQNSLINISDLYSNDTNKIQNTVKFIDQETCYREQFRENLKKT